MIAVGILLSLGLCVSCSLGVGVAEGKVSVPEVPGAWLAILGEPDWLILWFGPDGTERNAVIRGAGRAALEFPSAVATPVLAYPHWPGAGVEAGLVRPAGALVPFDLRSGRIALSWKGGISAVFYRELLRSGGPADRLPERFDWPRFGKLLDSDSISPAASEDPWRVDWQAVAVATRAYGFDSRRIAPRRTVSVRVPAPCVGPWVRTSPFLATPLETEDGFFDIEATDEPDSLLSRQGILRFDREAFAWFPRRP